MSEIEEKRKEFPQNKLQEEIYHFWRIRGWGEVTAILGSLNVSFHRDNPKYNSLGLDYIYLEQFYKMAQEMARKEVIKDILSIWVKASQEAMNTKQLLLELKYRINEYKQSLNIQEATQEHNLGKARQNSAYIHKDTAFEALSGVESNPLEIRGDISPLSLIKKEIADLKDGE